jgi:membrane protein DedA with SNARE-associated domain
MHSAIGSLATFIASIISQAGYGGVAFLMAVESACLPLPSEVIMPFAGYLASIGRFNLYLAATAGAIGCNLGSAVAYEIGAWGGRPFIHRWGRYILVEERELARVERLFHRHGGITVLVGRLLPVIRTFIALPAGIGHMNRTRFHIYTFIGSWPWCYGLALAGYELGTHWDSSPLLQSIMHRADVVVILLILAGLSYFLFTRLRHRR